MPGEKLVEIMKEASRQGIPPTSRTDLVWGTVVQMNPIVVQVDKDPKLRLTSTFLKLSPLCLEKWFTIPDWHTNNDGSHGGHTGGDGSHTNTIPEHRVMVWRGLKVGDRVIMLRYNSGGSYYVLQREGDL